MKPTLIISFVILLSISAYAQKPDSITNEELTRYVYMTDSLETIKNRLSLKSVELAQGNAKISASRYKMLLPLVDDQKKLTEAKATPDEIAYLKKAMAIRTEESMKLQTTFSALMNEYVGFDTYNKIRTAIASNPKVKKRYDLLMASLKD